MPEPDTAATTRRRQLGRVALMAVIALVVVILVAVGIYVIAFVILAPMMG